MSPLHTLFDRYVRERQLDLGHLAVISRPWFGWHERAKRHEAARRTLLRALLASFALRLVWEELPGLGLDPSVWVPIQPGVCELPRNVGVEELSANLEPGGWLIHGSIDKPALLLSTVQPAERAVRDGADVALTASFDSDTWELCTRSGAAETLARQLANGCKP